MPTCTHCQSIFPEPTEEDSALYKRLEVDSPLVCKACSERNRLLFRNERRYYKRKCDLTGKDIISIYSPDSPYTVYERESWFSDAYDPSAYGREIDFSRPFFEQLKELSLAVPYEHMVIINSENCDYCNFIVDSKNCYLSVRTEGEDVSYSYLVFNQTRDVCDCYNVSQCERCYECIDCNGCHSCTHLLECKQCIDCRFCSDCIGCKRCIGCVGLRHKEYHIFNEPYSKDEYEKKAKELQLSSYSETQNLIQQIHDLTQKRPQRFARIEQSESATGDYIVKSKNIIRSFDIEESEDVAESIGVEFGKDIARGSFLYHPELCYEHLSCTYAQRIRYCYGIYNSHDIDYSMLVYSGSHDCFGCIGLKGNQYMILNKQYEKDEYFALKEKLIAHMKETGEYGRFFPPDLSHFAYNETAALEYYPLTKEEALQEGLLWKDDIDEAPNVTKIIPAEKLPDRTEEIPDDVLNWALKCMRTERLYRITKKELALYRELLIPLPRLHPDERHYDRLSKRRRRELHERTCSKCQKKVMTAYASDKPKLIYCEECYLSEVY